MRADIQEEANRFISNFDIKSVMDSVTQYHCEKCSMEFPSLAELNNHQISKHSNVPD